MSRRSAETRSSTLDIHLPTLGPTLEPSGPDRHGPDRGLPPRPGAEAADEVAAGAAVAVAACERGRETCGPARHGPAPDLREARPEPGGVSNKDCEASGRRRLHVGTTNVWWIVSFWKPITSGKRAPGSSCTSKISSTAVWNSSRATTRPRAQVHHRHAALQLARAARRAARRPSPTSARIFDRPTNAYGPRQRQAAGEAGQLGHRLAGGRWRDRRARAGPVPDSSSQSRPSCQRGECGIDRPRATTSPLGTSIRQPPWGLFGPPAVRRVGLAQGGDVPAAGRRPWPGRSGGSGPRRPGR